MYNEYDNLFILILGDKKPSKGDINTKEKFDFCIKDNVFNLTDLYIQISSLGKNKKKEILKYFKKNLDYVGKKGGSDKKKIIEISDNFKSVIKYISKNDFQHSNVEIVVDIDCLIDEYAADAFFIKQKSPLLSDLSSLNQIVALYTHDGVFKANNEVENEILNLRNSIIKEYRRIILNK
ncbi:hypothetical protein RJQ12_25480 [Paenibacillus taichungensis]|nr:hypothetical protein [Paenibacillus taichungensis]